VGVTALPAVYRKGESGKGQIRVTHQFDVKGDPSRSGSEGSSRGLVGNGVYGKM
jgi:hypothetical protein